MQTNIHVVTCSNIVPAPEVQEGTPSAETIPPLFSPHIPAQAARASSGEWQRQHIRWKAPLTREAELLPSGTRSVEMEVG